MSKLKDQLSGIGDQLVVNYRLGLENADAYIETRKREVANLRSKIQGLEANIAKCTAGIESANFRIETKKQEKVRYEKFIKDNTCVPPDVVSCLLYLYIKAIIKSRQGSDFNMNDARDTLARFSQPVLFDYKTLCRVKKECAELGIFFFKEGAYDYTREGYHEDLEKVQALVNPFLPSKAA